MIQATELRIGNLIEKSLKSGQGRKIIDKVGIQDIVRIFENTGSFNYETIPLTEDCWESPTNKKEMKAVDARILTNQSIQDSLLNIEEHPEYIAVCDKIRAAARGNEKETPKTYVETEIFNKKVRAKLEADGFKTTKIIEDKYEIRW